MLGDGARGGEVLEEQPGKQGRAVPGTLGRAEPAPPLLDRGEHARVVGLDRPPGT